MRKGIVFALWIFLLLFVTAAFFISFSSYVSDREKKIMTNVNVFLINMNKGLEKIDIPFPTYTIVVYTEKPTGRKIISSNFSSFLKTEDYTRINTLLKEGNLDVYIKKLSLTDYFIFVSEQPFYTGLLVASLLLYLSIVYFTVKEFETMQEGKLTEDLVNRLKALRLTLATVKILPDESLKEMRKVVDSILNKLSKK